MSCSVMVLSPSLKLKVMTTLSSYRKMALMKVSNSIFRCSFFVTSRALFIQVILCHVLFITSRQSAQIEKENRLLNTLPLSRWSIVTGKYLFYFLCALGNALWLTLIALFMVLMGMPGVISPYMQFMMMMATGIIYFTFMLPVSYCSPQYTGAVALIVYLVVIFIPSKLPGMAGHRGGWFSSVNWELCPQVRWFAFALDCCAACLLYTSRCV